MNVGKLQQVEALFHAALEQEPATRHEFLCNACAADEELYAEVESLLAADEQALAFIVAAAPVIAQSPHTLPQADEHIRQYRLLHEIGRGGMGVVWLAERDDQQFQQRVAIKVIKRGMDTEEITRRFAQERQILASLNHPHIARLIDGGETADGRPWLALEYVEGKRLDRYCESYSLDLTARLDLFCAICAAVQYAHQHLVIHRDLKPGNIMVVEDGTPKLLDFGIAKLFDPEDDTGKVTATGQPVMTLEYASPEQVRGVRVTTASDVYSLGVILYELLTDQRPYDLTNHPLHEKMQIVCETEPRKPSHTEVTKVTERWSRKLAGDLDSITLKALRKEPERRYVSAAELMDDIQRYLSGLPVRASRDTFFYRTAKFIRRNKTFVAATAIVVLSLLTGIIVAAWQARVARTQAVIAQQERDKARRINEFLRTTFSYANPILTNPGHGKGPDARLVDALRYAEEQIDEKFRAEPDIRGELHLTLGHIWRARGELESAAARFRAALELFRQLYGERHPRTIKILYHLGVVEGYKTGDLAATITVLRQAVEMMRQSDPQNKDFPQMLKDLGETLGEAGNFTEAESLILEAREAFHKLAGTEDHYDVAYTFCRLGNLYLDKGELDRAQAYYHEYLERLRRLPVKHEAGEALYNLGVIDYTRGNYQEAEKSLHEADKLFSQYLGADYPQIAEFLYYLASIHCRQKDYARAEAEARRALEISRQKLGPEHPRMVISLGLLSKVLISAGKPDRAAPYLREALEKQQVAPTRSSGRWSRTASIVGECLTLLKRYKQAERKLLESYNGCECDCSQKSPDTVEMCQRLVNLYQMWGKKEQADHYRF